MSDSIQASLGAQPWPMTRNPANTAPGPGASNKDKFDWLSDQAIATSPVVDAALDEEVVAGEAFCALLNDLPIDGQARTALLNSAVAFVNAGKRASSVKANVGHHAIENVLEQNLRQTHAALQKAQASPSNSHMLGSHDPREGRSGVMVPDVHVELPPININFAEGSFQLNTKPESSELWMEQSPDGRQTRISRNPTNRDRFR